MAKEILTPVRNRPRQRIVGVSFLVLLVGGLLLVAIQQPMVHALAPGAGQPGIATAAEGKPAADVRVALVATDKTEILTNALMLAEARLTQVPGVRLLERQNIDRVLAEQKLNLSGPIATDQVLTLGKLLAVDLFAVVEASADKKGPGGLVIFEAGTGVRLWDGALPSNGLDKTVTAMVDALGTARTKRQAAPSKRTVCLLTVRNTDLPRELDALCDSVGVLLERQLVTSPDLALLERRRLEQVNKERDLPLDSPLRPLLASVVTLELEVGASPDRKGLQATALLSDGQGKSLGKVTSTVATRDAAGLAQALARELTRALNTRTASAAGLRLQEAKRFLHEAVFCWNHKEWNQALRAAEAAHALQPEEPLFHLALGRGLVHCAVELFTPGMHTTTTPFIPNVDPEKLEWSLALARRGSELLIEGTKIHGEGLRNFDLTVADVVLNAYVFNLGTIESKVNPANRARIEALRASQQQLHVIRFRGNSSAVKDEMSFYRYTEQVCRAVMEDTRSMSSARWMENLEEVRTWAKLARTYYDIQAIPTVSPVRSAVWTYYVHPPQLTNAAMAHGRLLWAELQKNPNLAIAFEALLAGHLHELNYGTSSGAERKRRVHDFRLSVQARLEESANLAEPLRGMLYRVAAQGIEYYKPLPRSEALEERKSLCAFMVTHKEIEPACFVRMVTQIVRQTHRSEDYRSVHQLLRQGLDLLEGGTGRFLVDSLSASASKHLFRVQCYKLLVEIYQYDPAIVPGFTTPWEKVTLLMDAYPNEEGIAWLQQPLVHEGSVYTAAISLKESSGACQVRLLQLSPGQEAVVKSSLLDVAFHPGMLYRFDPLGLIGMENDRATRRVPLEAGSIPLLHRSRTPLTLGTTACIHEGCYYLGTRAQGIFVFPLDAKPPGRITVEDGLPSNVVESLACLGDHLYAALGEPGKESYLVAWALRTRKCQVLASSRRKEKLSPFDNANPLWISTLLADPRRDQVLFSTSPYGGGGSGSAEQNAVWAFQVRSHIFTRLLTLHDNNKSLLTPNSRMEGDRLVMPSYQGFFVLGLAGTDRRLLFNNRVPLQVRSGRTIGQDLATLPNWQEWAIQDPSIRPPFLVADGWIWWSSLFCRWSLDGKKVELLTPLRSVPHRIFQPTETLQKFRGEREVLVGDGFGLWIVTLPEDKSKRADR